MNRILIPYVEFGHGSDKLNISLDLIHACYEQLQVEGGSYGLRQVLALNSIFKVESFSEYFEPGQIKLDESMQEDNGRLYLNPTFIFTRKRGDGKDVFTHANKNLAGEALVRDSEFGCLFNASNLVILEREPIEENSDANVEQIVAFCRAHLKHILMTWYQITDVETGGPVDVDAFIPDTLDGIKVSYFPNDRNFTNRLNLVFEIEIEEHLDIIPLHMGRARTMGWIPMEFIITMISEGQPTKLGFVNETHLENIGL